MSMYENSLVVTHIVYRKEPQIVPIEGPYSFLGRSLKKIIKNVEVFGVPLTGFENEVSVGKYDSPKKIYVPKTLGKWLPAKFITDFFLIFFTTITWSLKNWGKKKLIIGIDPLSCLPLLMLKRIFGYTLIFYCVDFNKNRFNNKLLQKLYELADSWSTKYSDQTWVICDALKEYKKKIYGINTQYLPNSVVFDPKLFEEGKIFRTGDKMVWTGSLMTDRQFDILFGVFSLIQTKINNLKFVLAPTRDYDRFEKYIKKYKIKNAKVLRLNSRHDFQKIASRCDVGIALYDERFGSTKFIEPMKIWDFLLCGLPFVVSCEPSITKDVVESGVAYLMNPKNRVLNIDNLKLFLSQKNLAQYSQRCLEIAKKYDFDRQVKIRINKLLSDELKNTK